MGVLIDLFIHDSSSQLTKRKRNVNEIISFVNSNTSFNDVEMRVL